MKKTLLALSLSVALIPVAFADNAYHRSPSQNNGPELKISGYTSVNASFVKQANTSNGKGGTEPHLAIGASSLKFNAKAKGCEDISYGVTISLDTYPGESANVKETYITLAKKGWGTVKTGAVYGPTNSMHDGGLSLIGGAFGVYGTLFKVYNLSAGAIDGVYPGIYAKRAVKLAYYSPIWSGFQFAVSLTPDTSIKAREAKDSSKGTSIANTYPTYPNKAAAPFGKKQMSWTASYKDKIDCNWDVSLAASLITENTKFNTANSDPVHNGRAWKATAAVGYKTWRLAAGMIDNGHSRMPRFATTGLTGVEDNAHQGNAGKAYDVAIQKKMGAYTFALGYFHTHRDTAGGHRAMSSVFTATADFLAFPGLKFYAEYDAAVSKTSDALVTARQAYDTTVSKTTIGNNHGQVFILGTKVSF